MTKRTRAALLLATTLLLTNLACKSGDQAQSNANTPVKTGNVTVTSPVGPEGSANQGTADQKAAPNANENPFSELVMLYSQLFTARMKNDRAKVEGLLADDYKETTADGKVLTKAQVLSNINPNQKFDTYSLDDLKSTTNNDTGTVTGRVSVVREGKTESWQFTDTFRKEQDHWLDTSSKITNYKKQ